MKQLDSLRELAGQLKQFGAAGQNGAAQVNAALAAMAKDPAGANALTLMLSAVKGQLTTMRSSLEKLELASKDVAAKTLAHTALESLRHAELALSKPPKDQKALTALESTLRRALDDAPKALEALQKR